MMPLHKNSPSTRGPRGGINGSVTSGTPSVVSAITDKSSEAARMARELASQSSWAERYVPGTPATTVTPDESVADTQSQLDTSEPPPSYEDARLERVQPTTTQMRQENVRGMFPSTDGPSPPNPSQDVESGVTTPLLYQDLEDVKSKQAKQKRFVVVFLILAIWLMGIQAVKSFGIGFWRSDGTPLPPVPQRTYTQHETSTGISGTFTFFDGLDLSTTSGSINIEIDPQYSENVGVIRLASRSGTIKVKFSDEYLKRITAAGALDRTFDIEVQSSSGSQNLELPQGNGGTTSLIAESGTISSKFHMLDAGRSVNATKLTTATTSGTHVLTFKRISSDPISGLAGNFHSTGSGTIKVFLPSAWEGMIHGSSGGSGSVTVKGDGLQYQRNGNKELYAWRVHGDSDKQKGIEGQVLEMRSDGSGSIKVDCSAS